MKMFRLFVYRIPGKQANRQHEELSILNKSKYKKKRNYRSVTKII